MKKILMIFILTLAFIDDLSAIYQDSVTLELRNKAYKHYLLLQDTTTIRTWLNMDRMNKALLEVMIYDNKLLKSHRYNDSVLKANSQLTPDTLLSQRPIEVVNPSVSNPFFDKEHLLTALAVSGILVIVLLVILIIRSIRMDQIRRTLDESEEAFNSKIKHMEFLESEVKKMKSREKEIKADLEKGIIDYQGKMHQLRLRIDELAEENTRLEGLLATHPGRNYAENVSSSGETLAIKKELIDKLETMLARLKDMNV